jgi:hypothetical protein
MYIVLVDTYIQEFNVELVKGDRFQDGDLEPDLIANLLSTGVIEDENAVQPELPKVSKGKHD